MRKVVILTLLFLAACSHSSPRHPSSSNLPWGIDLNDVPEAQSIQRWSDPHYADASAPDLDSLERVEIPKNCGQQLFPTHPQQFTKIYHVFRRGEYDAQEVPSASSVCKAASNGQRRFCLATDYFEHAVISDIYQDGCGYLYRGIWKTGFLGREETMGHLFSKGRTLYPKPRSQFDKDMEEGNTYALDRKEFLFLTPAFEGDFEKAGKYKEASETSFVYDSSKRLFQKRP
jgi:hypothetical protein